MKNPSPRIARWILKLSSHAFDIVHRSEVLMNVHNSLFRIPEALETAFLDLSTLKHDRWLWVMYYTNMSRCRSKFLDNGSEWKIVVPTSNSPRITKDICWSVQLVI
ncbi:hypothetical protein WA026_022049 [Henosepilachna vigintioctopunctata]|uniref:Uncharacterized protein n=1 Tax=Henosepilachna vigintioctopunctata TaxID=420089 RepID=A0AAW1UCR9_9CUCU